MAKGDSKVGQAVAIFREVEEQFAGRLALGVMDFFSRRALLPYQVGISRSHLCDIEKGRKTVSPARAARFAKILGYSDKQFIALALQDLVQKDGLKLKVIVEAA